MLKIHIYIDNPILTYLEVILQLARMPMMFLKTVKIAKFRLRNANTKQHKNI